jgi:SAM-dependent methyltransferase
MGFDVLAEAYDAMVNWEKRLANEAPFFRGLFDELKAEGVLDAACGTGRHAAMFAGWGLEVEGADLSEEMILWCRRRYAGVSGLRWTARSFLKPAPAKADVVVCTGNSLALVGDLDACAQAIAAMGQSARRALVLHVVNLYCRPEGLVRWDKSRRVQLSTGPHFLNKGIHRCGERGYVDLVLQPLDEAEAQVITQCVAFIGLRAPWLIGQLRACGFERVECYGDYQRRPFEESTSPDLIAVARV